ncbi:hypothetical protein MiSe_54630 [Microseira wollei NIES-4236]|uniref:Uncharacterized protein n=2 Tax=Microseira wollei TaxID=467598 RepID=A0AAV3XCN0_9CYAN|nr:hypothetical protein MiSe_54630 [Microseira wollei NIES-4236]
MPPFRTRVRRSKPGFCEKSWRKELEIDAETKVMARSWVSPVWHRLKLTLPTPKGFVVTHIFSGVRLTLSPSTHPEIEIPQRVALVYVMD